MRQTSPKLGLFHLPAGLRFATLSIRARIAALALVPFVAFAVIAAATWSGQQQLDVAFDAYSRDAATARLALLLTSDVVTMQYEARRLAQTRAADAGKTYTAASAKLAKDFGDLKTLTAGDKMASLRFTSVSALIRRTNDTFSKLVTLVADLGHSNVEGRTKELEASGSAGSEDRRGGPRRRVSRRGHERLPDHPPERIGVPRQRRRAGLQGHQRKAPGAVGELGRDPPAGRPSR